jgi:hypothetical protein
MHTYQRSFASRSISHITPFFRSFFEDVQTEEVFVFFLHLKLVDSDAGYGDMKATHTSEPSRPAERSMPGPGPMPNATVCVYVWLILIVSRLSRTHRSRFSNLHRSPSFSIARARFHLISLDRSVLLTLILRTDGLLCQQTAALINS